MRHHERNRAPAIIPIMSDLECSSQILAVDECLFWSLVCRRSWRLDVSRALNIARVTFSRYRNNAA